MCCRPFFNNLTTPSPTTWKNKPAKRQCMKTIRHPELYKKSTRNRTNDDDTLISDVVDYIHSCRERERYTFCGVQTKMQRWRHILFTIPDMSIIIAFAQSRSCLIAHPVFFVLQMTRPTRSLRVSTPSILGPPFVSLELFFMQCHICLFARASSRLGAAFSLRHHILFERIFNERVCPDWRQCIIMCPRGLGFLSIWPPMIMAAKRECIWTTERRIVWFGQYICCDSCANRGT